jgi:hypothetical protein
MHRCSVHSLPECSFTTELVDQLSLTLLTLTYSFSLALSCCLSCCVSSNDTKVSIFIIVTAWEYCRSQDSSVSIVMGYGLDGPGSIPGSERLFSTPQHPDRFWGPLSLLSNGHQGVSLGRKWPGREAEDSPPSSAEVKKGGAIPPLLHMSSWHSA